MTWNKSKKRRRLTRMGLGIWSQAYQWRRYWKNKRKRERKAIEKHIKVIKFISDMLIGIGLIGLIVGLMIML